MAIEIEETAVYGLQPGARMTVEDGMLRQKYGPGNLEVEDFYEGSEPMEEDESPEAMQAQVAQMSDEELMSIVGPMGSGPVEQAAGVADEAIGDEEEMAVEEGRPSGPMAYMGQTSGVGTPEGQNAFVAEELEENEQPEDIARELLARRAAARLNRSQNFQQEARALNDADPIQQYMG